jgi:4-oxalocrotonate tautomerase
LRQSREVDLPYVKLEIAKGIASVEQKRAVIRGITDVLVTQLGRDPEYIFVVIDEVDTDNWGRKGKSLTELWSERDESQT